MQSICIMSIFAIILIIQLCSSVLGALVAGHLHCHSLRQLCGKITGQSQIARGLIIPYVWQAVLDSLRDSVRIDRLSRQRLSSC